MLTSTYQESVLRKLTKALAEKCLGKLNQTVFLYHGNTSAHSSYQGKIILQISMGNH